MLGERNEPEQSRERSLKLEAAGVGAGRGVPVEGESDWLSHSYTIY